MANLSNTKLVNCLQQTFKYYQVNLILVNGKGSGFHRDANWTGCTCNSGKGLFSWEQRLVRTVKPSNALSAVGNCLHAGSNSQQ